MNDVRDLVRQRFGATAERYVQSAVHQRGESLDRLLALAAPRPEWYALDVATGGGHTALALAPRVREVVATDLTPAMLDAARAFIESKGVRNVRFEEADATALPFADSSFDLVTCRIAPHHFPDVPRFVRETYRVLRPGGVAIVIDNVVPEDRAAAEFINAFERTRDPSHVRSLPPSAWLRCFEEAGFQAIHLEGFRKLLEFESWTAMQSVDEPTRLTMRGMLAEAPPAALNALFPEDRDGKLWIHIDELLIEGKRPTAI